MSHLALWAGSREELDALVVDASRHGWSLMFTDKHPHAGGPNTYAAYLEDAAGFEVNSSLRKLFPRRNQHPHLPRKCATAEGQAVTRGDDDVDGAGGRTLVAEEQASELAGCVALAVLFTPPAARRDASQQIEPPSAGLYPAVAHGSAHIPPGPPYECRGLGSAMIRCPVK